MKCPTCMAAELVHDTRDMPYIYKGESTLIPAVTGNFCPACDESILDAVESRRTMNFMLEFNKQVNAAIVDPDFIAEVRKKLALDQREAAEIFGGGVNAFSRYKNAALGAGEVAQAARSSPGIAERNQGRIRPCRVDKG